ncbi:MAG: NAD-dependent epimerase/dehydratase family protein [Solirubrobacteraceae bacterium]
MRILVLGADGYLGWPTAIHLSAAGHDVAVSDNFARRGYDEELGVESLVPIATLQERLGAWSELTGKTLRSYVGDLRDAGFVHQMVADFRPDTIVHYAEQRAAPYSMIDQAHAVYTQTNNVVGTLNVMYAIADIDRDIHLVKLGTMGEYGTPNIDIEEGWITIEHNGRSDRMIYPKRPGSFYHLTKVHDSHNIEFGCRIWGLRATDLNQGVVYGADTEHTKLDPRLATRFDYDGVFGTVLNRMVIQAVLGHPLTVYGNGSQTRGLINILDTVECIRLASETPAQHGEFRVFNQFTESLSIRQIADTIAAEYPGPCTIEHVENPRVEAEDHYYNPTHTALVDLGLKATLLSATLIDHMFDVVERHQDRVDLAAIMPTVNWRETSSEITRPTAGLAGEHTAGQPNPVASGG